MNSQLKATVVLVPEVIIGEPPPPRGALMTDDQLEAIRQMLLDRAAKPSKCVQSKTKTMADLRKVIWPRNPEDRKLVEDVMAQHPLLTLEEAIAALNEAGM
jgi:hypothetical protein